eukprot:SAG31_NODE_54_length_29987_cov_4.570664_23_plen_139_part_00
MAKRHLALNGRRLAPAVGLLLVALLPVGCPTLAQSVTLPNGCRYEKLPDSVGADADTDEERCVYMNMQLAVFGQAYVPTYPNVLRSTTLAHGLAPCPLGGRGCFNDWAQEKRILRKVRGYFVVSVPTIREIRYFNREM